MPDFKPSNNLVVAAVLSGGLSGLLVAMCPSAFCSEQMTDAEIQKALNFRDGSQIIRKDGKRMILTPLPDDAIDHMIVRQSMAARSRKERGIPERDPRHKSSEVLYWKAQRLMESGQFEAAVPVLTESIKKFEEESNTMKDENKSEHDNYLALGFQFRGFCYMQQKHYQLGVKDLTRAITLRPNYATNYMNRSKAYRLMGAIKPADDDEDMAVRLIQKAPPKRESLD